MKLTTSFPPGADAPGAASGSRMTSVPLPPLGALSLPSVIVRCTSATLTAADDCDDNEDDKVNGTLGAGRRDFGASDWRSSFAAVAAASLLLPDRIVCCFEVCVDEADSSRAELSDESSEMSDDAVSSMEVRDCDDALDGGDGAFRFWCVLSVAVVL